MLKNNFKKRFFLDFGITIEGHHVAVNQSMLRVWTFLWLQKLNRKSIPKCQKFILAKLVKQI